MHIMRTMRTEINNGVTNKPEWATYMVVDECGKIEYYSEEPSTTKLIFRFEIGTSDALKFVEWFNTKKYKRG